MGGEKLAERSQVWTVTNEATKEENTEIFVLFAVVQTIQPPAEAEGVKLFVLIIRNSLEQK